MSLDRGMYRLAKHVQADRLRNAAADRRDRAARADDTRRVVRTVRMSRPSVAPRRPFIATLRGLIGA